MAINLFLSILEISISVGLIVLVLILLSPFLNKRYAAKWKYWIWLFLALRLITPVGGTDIRTAADKIIQKVTGTESDAGKEDAGEETIGVVIDGTGLTGRVMVAIPEQMTMPLEIRSDKSQIRITALDIVALVWLVGCLLFLSVHLLIYLHYKSRLVRNAVVLKAGCIRRWTEELKRELHIRRKISVMKSPEAASPMIIGLFRPVLILPEEIYGVEELFFILKHELVHLRHNDLFFKLLFVTANAIHWFNPCIWLLQKEAVVDMELYCDESVIQGANYAGRKAYTETLLSTLHKQCAKRTVLSTQFYEGKKIMQKRFKNILSKKRKKNGTVVFIGAILLTVILGTLIGCSIAGENGVEGNSSEADTNQPGMEDGRFAQMEGRWVIDFTVTDSSLWGSGISYGNEMEISASGEFRYYIGIGVGGTGQCEETDDGIVVAIQPYEENLAEQEILVLNYVNQEGGEYIQMDWHGEDVRWRREDNQALPLDENDLSEAGQAAEDKAVLTIMVEGMEEQVPATLVRGEGYSFYLPDDEWQQSDLDIWTGLTNEQVQFQVSHQDGKTLEQVEQELTDSGYIEINDRIWRQEGEMIYGVALSVFEDDIWGIYFQYPVDSEEGWGRRIIAIADTLKGTN